MSRGTTHAVTGTGGAEGSVEIHRNISHLGQRERKILKKLGLSSDALVPSSGLIAPKVVAPTPMSDSTLCPSYTF